MSQNLPLRDALPTLRPHSVDLWASPNNPLPQESPWTLKNAYWPLCVFSSLRPTCLAPSRLPHRCRGHTATPVFGPQSVFVLLRVRWSRTSPALQLVSTGPEWAPMPPCECVCVCVRVCVCCVGVSMRVYVCVCLCVCCVYTCVWGAGVSESSPRRPSEGELAVASTATVTRV